MNDEERVRERAHAIWEAEGCPDGRDKEHWQQACRDLGIHVVAGEGWGLSQGGSPITPISGGFAQSEPPYAGTDPNAERTG